MNLNPLNGLVRHLRRQATPQAGDDSTDGELLARYAACRDEAAFAALLERHGPMVLGVCRRILRNEADAEDAFQATFLVLVRKAASIRHKAMVGNWLYGVAHYTALKAKAMIGKRQAKEQAAAQRPANVTQEICWQAQLLVDDELSCLAEKYRVPIVLCDLEGRTIQEAARHLGWPAGTVATRLARGRARLARRLSRTGLHLSAGAVAALLAQSAASAALPPPLATATIKAAGLFAAGTPVAGVVSTAAATLTQGVLSAMLLTKIKLISAVLLFVSVLTIGVGATIRAAQTEPGGRPNAQREDPKLETPVRKAQPPKDDGKTAGRPPLDEPKRNPVDEAKILQDKTAVIQERVDELTKKVREHTEFIQDRVDKLTKH